MEIFDLKNKQEYLNEVMDLEFIEWSNCKLEEKNEKIKSKIQKYYDYVNDNYFCKLILVDKDELIGFISIFPYDCEEEKELTPWYSTMYVKEKYRKKGYSKILNSAILKEAEKRNIKILYLKTNLNNYYEKFGAKLVKILKTGEKIMKFEIE